MNEKDIKKGFNNGYLMQQHAPKLAQRFAQSLTEREDAYAQGFIAGIKEREREMIKTRGKNYDVPKRSNHRPSHEKGKDKDHTKEDR